MGNPCAVHSQSSKNNKEENPQLQGQYTHELVYHKNGKIISRVSVAEAQLMIITDVIMFVVSESNVFKPQSLQKISGQFSRDGRQELCGEWRYRKIKKGVIHSRVKRVPDNLDKVIPLTASTGVSSWRKKGRKNLHDEKRIHKHRILMLQIFTD